MKIKYLWWLFPFSVMWLEFYVGHLVWPDIYNEAVWWDLPLVFTFIAVFLFSFFFTIKKTNE